VGADLTERGRIAAARNGGPDVVEYLRLPVGEALHRGEPTEHVVPCQTKGYFSFTTAQKQTDASGSRRPLRGDWFKTPRFARLVQDARFAGYART